MIYPKLTEEAIKQSEIKEIYLFYDQPILYTRNINDRLYLVLLVDDDECGNQKWLYNPISQNGLKRLIDSEIDLYEIFAQPEESYLYLIHLDDKEKYEILLYEDIRKIPEDYFPEKDVYLTN